MNNTLSILSLVFKLVVRMKGTALVFFVFPKHQNSQYLAGFTDFLTSVNVFIE